MVTVAFLALLHPTSQFGFVALMAVVLMAVVSWSSAPSRRPAADVARAAAPPQSASVSAPAWPNRATESSAQAPTPPMMAMRSGSAARRRRARRTGRCIAVASAQSSASQRPARPAVMSRRRRTLVRRTNTLELVVLLSSGVINYSTRLRLRAYWVLTDFIYCVQCTWTPVIYRKSWLQ